MNRLRHKKRSGFTLVELLIVVTIIGILIGILLPVLISALAVANQAACAANLKSVGNAIGTYCTKFQGHYPTVYQYAIPPTTGQGSNIQNYTTAQTWGDGNAGTGYENGSPTNFGTALPDWDLAVPPGQPASTQTAAFKCNLSGLFAMVKTGDAANEGIFKCPTDPNYQQDTTMDSQNYWSFHYITNCSYSYQNQLYDSKIGINGGGKNTSQNTLDPKMVVAADMNPSRCFDEAHTPSEISNYVFQKGVCTWNSPNHKYTGQNCLYGDGHVVFNSNPFCGYGNSNIWTQGTYTAAAGGGGVASGVWSNADPSAGGSAGPNPPTWTTPYGGTSDSGQGAGTGDKYNSFLVP